MNVAWRFRELVKWLVLDPSPYWAGLIVPLVGLATTGILPFHPELRVRASGFLVTLAGVGIVVGGIRDRRRHFGSTAYLERLRTWLARLPLILAGPTTITGQAVMTVGSVTLSGSATVRAVASPQATLAERVAVLEKNLKSVDDQLADVDRKTRKGIEETKEAIETESVTSRRFNESLRSQLEDLSVGNLDFEAVGVVWVVFGTAFSTFPAEIAALLGYLL